MRVFQQILTDPEIWEITLNTLKITGTAVAIAMLVGIAIAFFLSWRQFPGKKLIITIVNTGMGLPPVLAGLIISILFWRSGFFGDMNLLYTPEAMIIAEFILALPVVTALSLAAIQSVDQNIKEQFYALGASNLRATIGIIREARLSASAAVIAAYGAIISEVGAALMVGGNIKGETRVLTTAIVLETRKGNFDEALVLGLVLLSLAFAANIYLTFVQQRENR